MNQRKIVLSVLTAYLAFNFVQSLMPVSELPSSGELLFSILLDAGIVAALAGLIYSMFKSASAADEDVSGWISIGCIGLFAGLALLVVRVTSTPKVQLPAGIPTVAQALEADAIKARVRDAIAKHDELYRVAQQSHWLQSKDANVFQPGQITRDDLADYRELMLKETSACGSVLDALRAAEANHAILPVGAQDYWRANYSGYEDQSEQMKLLIENWSEWHRNGVRPDSPTLKPWQKELVRLQQKLEADTKTSIDLHKQLTQP